MKVGDEVYLRDDPTVKGSIEFIGVGCVVVRWSNGTGSCYTSQELILVSEYEKENAKINLTVGDTYEVNVGNCWLDAKLKAFSDSYVIVEHDGQESAILNDCIEIRQKPKTIRIGEYDVPEPIRKFPEMGGWYYLVSIEKGMVNKIMFNSLPHEHRWFANGLCQETKEGAELMLKALLSLTSKKS